MLFNILRKNSASQLQAIYQMPFNIELAMGTLPQEKFIFYLQQDALYLNDYARALALTAVKLQQDGLMHQFMEFSRASIDAEQGALQQYLTSHAASRVEASPTCFMYTNYLLSMATTASVEESVASLLPCFYIYHEVGQHLAKLSVNNNPYQAWIDMYAAKEFAASVSLAISAFNQLAAAASAVMQQKMLKASIIATRLEWLFWDSAYRMEQWPHETISCFGYASQ